MDNIILWIMAIAMVLGALDRMFGSRLGLGKQFEEGILAIGALSPTQIITALRNHGLNSSR